MAARSYGQYCGLARSLDAVGDRWSLADRPRAAARPDALRRARGSARRDRHQPARRSPPRPGSARRDRAAAGEAGSGVVYALTPWGEQAARDGRGARPLEPPADARGPGRGRVSSRAGWRGGAAPALLSGRTAQPSGRGRDRGPRPPHRPPSRRDRTACDDRPRRASRHGPQRRAGGRARPRGRRACTLDQALAAANVEGGRDLLAAVFARSAAARGVGADGVASRAWNPSCRSGSCGSRGGVSRSSVGGEGPPLVVPAWWVSHLELDWSDPAFRSFWEAVAAGRTLVRYDNVGVGMSDRDAPAGELDAGERGRAAGRGRRRAGRRASRPARRIVGRQRRDRVRGAAAGAGRAAAALRRVRRRRRDRTARGPRGASSRRSAPIGASARASSPTSSWPRRARRSGSGSRACSGSRRAPRPRRRCSSWSTASTSAASWSGCARRRSSSTGARTAAIPYEQGRALAAAIPGATLVTLAGRAHLPWVGDARSVARALRSSPVPADVAARADGEGEGEARPPRRCCRDASARCSHWSRRG